MVRPQQRIQRFEIQNRGFRERRAANTIEESDEIIADGSDKEFVELAKSKNEA